MKRRDGAPSDFRPVSLRSNRPEIPWVPLRQRARYPPQDSRDACGDGARKLIHRDVLERAGNAKDRLGLEVPRLAALGVEALTRDYGAAVDAAGRFKALS